MSARRSHLSEPAPTPAPATTTTAAATAVLDRATVVTADGASWLASASTHPRSTLALWESRPHAPVVLPCGSAFDVVSVPAVFGRRMLDRLWDEGPGSGPVAAHRGRMLVFAAPGTAQRLPSLLAWEEWSPAVPAPLCHGTGDAVTVPPLTPPDETAPTERLGSRWLVAPDTRHPWLPGPEALLWASVRVARALAGGAVRISIFPPADQDARVYDVSRRR
ncbi:bifunctional DNA primase/polymerase [Streptomyces sp. B-S-A8]|uniref:Bifunctional DNA primase/polymerase n=1 Tax=Streptomyces solicavernae TaxID=3043614 RepID=A0ABT6RT64_9ACTN|nr:bifunctional DNA primase/polymerase [Streptomyces sp. B-S-A8]MDI3386963.1 bifunctional DNA primase/polymerase [Streptomyces sp. B-S-A8]